ncbi:MAG: hypothetical protein PHV11_06930 [Candidatus Bipolaricaulis sp.]|nr:hypothetical protein [Candidatus Bipolaricaulis sp.]
MNDILVATIISEGGKILSELVRNNRAGKRMPAELQWPSIPNQLPNFTDPFYDSSVGQIIEVSGGPQPSPAPSAIRAVDEGMKPVDYAPIQSGGEKVATSCVGCAIGHLATCSGLLKEAVRFSDEGMTSPNIIDRLNTCLDELNAMERVDLLPNKIQDLPDWEKELAHRALNISRETRHFIEAGIASGDQLEKLAANLINERQAIGNAWLQQKLRALSTEDKAEIQRRVMAKLENIGEEK